MREIQAEAKTVRELLSNARYGIDFYQREYRWGAKQVQELLDDLAGEFLEDFDESHERTAVEAYGHYFLGSVIISHKKAQKFIVDGQQRMTTLTLLLIYLHNLLRDRELDDDATPISNLIFSKKYGSKSFNLWPSTNAPLPWRLCLTKYRSTPKASPSRCAISSIATTTSRATCPRS